MSITKIQKEFEDAALKNDPDLIFLDQFEDGEHWGNEDLTNCYTEGLTELCFSFFKLGRVNKSREFFEKELFKSCGKQEDLTQNENGSYCDDFVALLWKYFLLS